LTSEKISLKAVLKYAPGAGWAMACNAFIFLDRSFNKDETRMNNMLEYYAESGQNYQLLLYPEGTDKCPLATGRSKQYAEKNGFVHYDYVLHPRVTGFSHILQKMRSCDYLENLYDVTVAYPDEIVQSETDLFFIGACPKKIHFDVRKIDVKTIPTEDKEVGEWLTKLWAKKEERLEKFYSKPVEERELDSLPGDAEFALTFQTRLVQIYIICSWCFMSFTWFFVFWSYSYQFVIMILMFAFFYGCQYFYDGLESILTLQAKRPALSYLFGCVEEETTQKKTA